MAKLVGSVGAVAGGLAVGKEGPFVHAGKRLLICACVLQKTIARAVAALHSPLLSLSLLLVCALLTVYIRALLLLQGLASRLCCHRYVLLSPQLSCV